MPVEKIQFAFPVYDQVIQLDNKGNIQSSHQSIYSPGMTLRDYLTGQALIGITQALTQGIRPIDLPMMATDCYGIADAMMAARDRTEGA